MQPLHGDCIRIVLFEGSALEVMLATDRWFAFHGKTVEVVDIQYNYQGPEYDGSKKLSKRGTHGVLITFRPVSVNEVRKHQGYPPVGEQVPEHEHKWVSAKNEVVSSGEVCLACWSVREGESDAKQD